MAVLLPPADFLFVHEPACTAVCHTHTHTHRASQAKQEAMMMRTETTTYRNCLQNMALGLQGDFSVFQSQDELKKDSLEAECRTPEPLILFPQPLNLNP